MARGKLSPRLASILIRHLPIDSAYATAVRGGPEYAGWDRHAVMMADIYDAINSLTYLYQVSHAEKPKKVKPIPPYPRPGQKAAQEASKHTDPLRARLRGDAPAPTPLGPGSRIPPPPSRAGRMKESQHGGESRT